MARRIPKRKKPKPRPRQRLTPTIDEDSPSQFLAMTKQQAGSLCRALDELREQAESEAAFDRSDLGQIRDAMRSSR